MTYDAAQITAWLSEDPDPDTRAELQQLLDDDQAAEIADAFSGPLTFGTAGLRGKLGPGPNRMNRAVVRRAAAGLAQYLLDHEPDTAPRGVVIGYDARHKSSEFALDTAAVFAGRGIRAMLLPTALPTPVLAFCIRHLGAIAGVMVTASHNPPADNGYKVYLGDGAQIVSPVDVHISAAIAEVGPLSNVTMGDLDGPLVVRLNDEPVQAYVAAAAALAEHTARDLVVAYTPLHGVGRDTLLRVFALAGFPPPHVVAEQGDPDPTFPTVAFPNPEEPGALDLVLAAAASVDADLVIANDPDADRLAIAVPDPTAKRGWRALRGDEIGALLADYLIGTSRGHDRLVVTSIVSSTLLSKMAAAAGIEYAETLTGFKWIARAALARPDTRFLFGYEEALGFSVRELIRDKDGVGAAVVFAELAAISKRQNVSLISRLETIARRYGLHATAQWSVWLQGPDGADRIRDVMAALRTKPLPDTLAGRLITAVDDLSTGVRRSLDGGVDSAIDLPRSDVIALHMDGARVIVRPSGTEPKLKVYFEVVTPVRDDMSSAQLQADRELAALRTEMEILTGL